MIGQGVEGGGGRDEVEVEMVDVGEEGEEEVSFPSDRSEFTCSEQ